MAKADEVRLVNGDRLTGEIVKMEEGVLTFKTAYGGELSIDWKQVERLTSEKPMTVRIPGDTKGTLAEFFYGDHAMVTTKEIGLHAPVALSDVKSINLQPIRLTGTVTIGGNSTNGNTDTKAVNAAARFSIRAHRQRLMGEAKYNYGEASSTVTARNSLGNLKYDYFLSEKFFANTYGLLEKDTFQNLNLRTTLGAGMGYQFLETPRHTLAGEVGLAYVNEHYTNSESTRTPSSRWAIRWEYAILPDRVKVFHRQEGFYDLNAGNAVRIRADQGLRVTLYKNLFLNLEYDLRYNTQPAPGRLKADEAFIFGVGYELD
ncbi:MAG: DUF481 domain-containing protein [Nitrospiraceae bacterium]